MSTPHTPDPLSSPGARLSVLLADFQSKDAEYRSKLDYDHQTFVVLFAALAGLVGLFSLQINLKHGVIVPFAGSDIVLLILALCFLWFPANGAVHWYDKRALVVYIEEVLAPEIRSVLQEIDPPRALPSSLHKYLSFEPVEDGLYADHPLSMQTLVSGIRSWFLLFPTVALCVVYWFGVGSAAYRVTAISITIFVLITAGAAVCIAASAVTNRRLKNLVQARRAAKAST